MTLREIEALEKSAQEAMAAARAQLAEARKLQEAARAEERQITALGIADALARTDADLIDGYYTVCIKTVGHDQQISAIVRARGLRKSETADAVWQEASRLLADDGTPMDDPGESTEPAEDSPEDGESTESTEPAEDSPEDDS